MKKITIEHKLKKRLKKNNDKNLQVNLIGLDKITAKHLENKN